MVPDADRGPILMVDVARAVAEERGGAWSPS